MEGSNQHASIVVYECIRCGTRTNSEELQSLPELKCICGFRIFRKVRPPIAKRVKAV
ncbi:MAG: RNA polymerase Rbp10 [Candidatus Nitrosocaldus sp.]